jgi:hypothetical protein
MLDLNEMNESFFTLDTLWFCLKVNDEPLARFVTEKVRQFAEILKKAFFDLI